MHILDKYLYKVTHYHSKEVENTLLLIYFFAHRDRNLTENERNIIKKLATSEPVVRNLVLLWDLYMNTNHTGVDASNMTDWKEFLEEEREFVESFDFLKDLAIDNPGLYFVLVCTLPKRHHCKKFLVRF